MDNVTGENLANKETVTLYGVIFTDSDEATTRHSAHLNREDAERAGAELARARWVEEDGAEPFPDVPVGPFPECGSDAEAMDQLRGFLPVSLEVEPIEVSIDVIRALAALHL